MVVGRSVHHRAVVSVPAAKPKGRHKQSLVITVHRNWGGGGACAASLAGGGVMQITGFKRLLIST